MQFFYGQKLGLVDGSAVLQEGWFLHDVSFGLDEDYVQNVDEILNHKKNLLETCLSTQF